MLASVIVNYWPLFVSYSKRGLVVGFKSNCHTRNTGTIGGMPSAVDPSKGSQPIFTRVSEKTTENSEWLARQARPRNEIGTTRLSFFEHSHWWGQGRIARHPCLTWDSNPGPLDQQPASLTTSPPGGSRGTEPACPKQSIRPRRFCVKRNSWNYIDRRPLTRKSWMRYKNSSIDCISTVQFR